MKFYSGSYGFLIFWIILFLAIKLLVCNFLVGALYVYYCSLYESEVEYINQFPELAKLIKKDISQDKLTNERLE